VTEQKVYVVYVERWVSREKKTLIVKCQQVTVDHVDVLAAVG
jgi:hypothetical protein